MQQTVTMQRYQPESPPNVVAHDIQPKKTGLESEVNDES